MYWRGSLRAAVLAAGLTVMGWTAPVSAGAVDEDYRLTGPYAHANLAIYLIHRQGGEDGPVPLTLGEAMGEGLVKILETGDVEELVIRNLGNQEVFIQAGDIVKGGKQDRVLIVSMMVPPHSGDIPVGAFCVEEGRWSGRGEEDVAEFSASTERVPSKAARVALAERVQRELVPEAGGVASQPQQQPRSADVGLRVTSQLGQRQGPAGAGLQGQVWESVREVQTSLGRAMSVDVADERSRSSLQLSLENKALAAALEEYEATLGGLLQGQPDAVGYVFAVNGRINSGDEFGSAGLFRKLWPRQLKAAATEAIAEEGAPMRDRVTLTEVAAFIDGLRAAEPVGKPMPGRMSLETRETGMALYTEIRRRNGPWVHRSFIAH